MRPDPTKIRNRLSALTLSFPIIARSQLSPFDFQRAQNFHRLSPSGSLAFEWRKSGALFNQREHTVLRPCHQVKIEFVAGCWLFIALR
jgi:hypothetical protein